jgi:hypothetical protein
VKRNRESATAYIEKATRAGERADLRFALAPDQRNGLAVTDSQLHMVMADGHAIAESTPLPQPGVQLPETRILRSEHIVLEMKPGGQDVQETRTPSQAQLEFKPTYFSNDDHLIVEGQKGEVAVSQMRKK